MNVKELIEVLHQVPQDSTVVTLKLKEDGITYILECHCVHKRIDGTNDIELIFGAK